MCWIQVPPEVDRVALEYYEQCVCNPNDSCDSHDDPDDPDVNGVNSYAQQEQSYGNLEDGGAYSVKNLAKEPKSQRSLGGFICDIFSVLTASMKSGADLATEIDCEEDQCNDHHLIVKSKAFDKYSSGVHISLCLEEWKLCGTAGTNLT